MWSTTWQMEQAIQFAPVFDRDGNSKVLKWTLANFMELNNLYASKTRLYCVEK